MESKIKEFLQYKKTYDLEPTINKKEFKLLKKNYPFQKIVGYIDYDGLKIFVNKKVLIPRYETQEVVLKALEYIKPKDSVLDLGCGSGYIGLTIAQKTKTRVTLVDNSLAAIKQTKINAQYNNLKNIEIIKSNMFKKINQKFSIIISNPPYIPKKTRLSKDVLNFEPKKALFAKKDGNYFYKTIMNNYQKYLKKGGYLILETSEDNVDFLKQYNFQFFKDINNKIRIAVKKN